mmetsp:Transcript_34399/g.78407  ORF Transcript_34399/g.78407 Transcript_34399/m.78407 type:complete len:113 (+) Transcript_34399:832-1170(+)
MNRQSALDYHPPSSHPHTKQFLDWKNSHHGIDEMVPSSPACPKLHRFCRGRQIHMAVRKHKQRVPSVWALLNRTSEELLASKLTTARNATGMRRGNGSRYLRRTIEFELNMT